MMAASFKGRDRRALRLTLGVGLAVALSASIAWSLAFVAPVFAAKFLVERAEPTWGTARELLFGVLVTVAIAFAVSFGPIHYPLVFLPLLALVMLWAYFLFSDPRWNFFASMLIIAALLLPYLGLLHPGIALELGIGLAFSGVVAVLVFTLMHLLIPEEKAQSNPSADAEELPDGDTRTDEAVRALVIAFPVVCFFFLAQITDALLTMIFIAVLSLQASGAKSVKVSLFLLVTNGVGGVVAVLIYQLLVVMPYLGFYVALAMLVTIVLASYLYADPDKAPLYAGILSTVLVLVGSTASSMDKEVVSNFYLRLLQIAMVGAYMVFISYFLESRSRPGLSLRP